MAKHHIVHHADADGHAAAAILYLKLTRQSKISDKNIYFIRINYGQTFRDEKINYYQDRVYVVDYMLQPESLMQELNIQLGRRRLTWIDHHTTSMDCEKEYQLQDVAGIRDTKASACELCWEFYFPQKPMPKLLKLIGDWDTFRRGDKWSWENEVLPLQTYLFSVDTRPHANINFWMNLLESSVDSPGGHNASNAIENMLRQGRLMHRYRVRSENSRMGAMVYKGTFAGYSAYLANASHANSLMFERVCKPSEVDLMVAYSHVKGKYWSVSIYTEKSNIDCAALAKKLGYEGPLKSGGGHRQASGFQTDWEHLSSYIKTEEEE
jgi:oligoribonuclease NrnB/cAMP/cGMP phosphodiesterase (DHH superfamily)